jgi:chaperone required for assembly of F1-ATPase
MLPSLQGAALHAIHISAQSEARQMVNRQAASTKSMFCFASISSSTSLLKSKVIKNAVFFGLVFTTSVRCLQPKAR